MNLEKLEKDIMNELKDFQRATVSRCYDIYQSGKNRILVADEVGLGKTLIAKGVIAKLANKHKKEDDKLFKVLYICSNSSIANQNIRKLKIHNGVTVDGVSDTRLSMQHLKIFEQENDSKVLENYIQLIPLTPSTSFTLSSRLGSQEERALIFAVLKRYGRFELHLPELEKMLTGTATTNLIYNVNTYVERVNECDRISSGNYLKTILAELDLHMDDKLYEQIIDCCHEIKLIGKATRTTETILSLRLIFSQISIKFLNPDLVIMDEFQRFRELITAPVRTDTAILTNAFLKTSNVKTLLLSATPYKLYQTMEETAENGVDEQYKEFLEVMDFLIDDKTESKKFKEVWNNYGISLREIASNRSVLINAKRKAESEMYKSMCRTERFIVDNKGEFIDDADTKKPLSIEEKDILSFIEMQRLADQMKEKTNIPVEYVKSCPYLMSFMLNYKLKEKLKKAQPQIGRKAKPILFLNREKIRNYESIPSNNSRLEKLKNLAFANKSELLLWVPPSRPYYETTGVFKKAEGFSKMLVFSAWEMVPRMIACMVSYESERLTIGNLYNNESLKLGKDYFAKKRFPSPRLDESRERPLITPSVTLSEMYNPIKFIEMSLKQIKAQIENEVENHLTQIRQKYDIPNTGGIDPDWYYIAPLLMDGEDVKIPTKKMPSDIAVVLTNMAIASPACCAYRIFGDKTLSKEFAKCISDMFNKPEAIAIVEIIYGQKNDDFYYKNVLNYCVDGNFAAVMDEYAHALNDSNKTSLKNQMCDAMTVKTASYDVDSFDSFTDKANGKKISLRSNFAAGFYQVGNDEKTGQRKESLRNAFNSPFRPFVLATTSIGQEGLDFHNYARKIMHWNLPSNPIDLEQREGRINRYKCLSIRQSVAKKYGKMQFRSDVWNELFEEAKVREKGDFPELVPYWCLPNGGEVKIERIVPMYPLSKDVAVYKRLIKILSHYRITMGHARQEELLETLLNHYENDTLDEMFIKLSPYYKEQEKINEII